jgi:hypothetical protein
MKQLVAEWLVITALIYTAGWMVTHPRQVKRIAIGIAIGAGIGRTR